MPDFNSSDTSDDFDPSVKILNYLMAGRLWEQLLQKAQERLARDGGDEPGHRASAVALIYLYRPDEASKHVQFLLSNNPEYHYYHVLAGHVACQQMKLSLARQHFSKALSLDVENAGTHRLMAEVLAALGEVNQALHHVNIAQRLDADCADSWSTREAVLEANTTHIKHWRERIQVLENGLALAPNDPIIQWRIGRLLQALERNAAAEKWLAQALSHAPCCPVFINDWRDSLERKNFIYRCLSYPWRQWRTLRALYHHSKERPDLAGQVVLGFQSWIIVLIWWGASWVCIAPIGLVWRYYMQLHPAFDLRWMPRRWVRGRSIISRIFLMVATLVVTGMGLYLLTSRDFLDTWFTLSCIHLSCTASVTLFYIGARWLTAPNPPKGWLMI